MPASSAMTFFVVVKRNATGAYHSVVAMNYSFATGLGVYFAGATQQAWQTDDLFVQNNGFLNGVTPQVVVGATGSALAGNAAFHVVQATLGTAGTFALIDNAAYPYRVNSTGTPPVETSKVFSIGWNGAGDWAAVDLQAVIIGLDLNGSDQSNLYRYLNRKYAVR